MKVDPAKYDYVMYVDASGDDGFKFEKGSSACYAASALLVKAEDIAYNLGILDNIKRVLGCKLTDEVKYSRIRRHRKKDQAMEKLEQLKGNMSCYVDFKKELDPKEYIGTKALSVVCHCMALRSIDSYHFAPSDKVLVVIDRMKQTEEEPVREILESQNLTHHREFAVDIIFRDSKDTNFLLIQIADLLCGATREHFEQYETQADMKYFATKCPSCMVLTKTKGMRAKPLCKGGKGRVSRILQGSAFAHVFCLFPNNGAGLLDYFFVQPARMIQRFFYLLCKKI